MLRRIPNTRRYEPIPEGIKTISALIVLRDKIIKPLLAAAIETNPARGSLNPTSIDRHYHTLRLEIRGLFTELGVAA